MLPSCWKSGQLWKLNYGVLSKASPKMINIEALFDSKGCSLTEDFMIAERRDVYHVLIKLLVT